MFHVKLWNHIQRRSKGATLRDRLKKCMLAPPVTDPSSARPLDEWDS
jgi:hypothetical protein